MKILLIEPYFTGSHKQWAEGFKLYSKHDVRILSMKGQFWKWRMHGGAITLAESFNQNKWKPDLILCTDMLDLTTFLSLTRKKTKNIPTAIYFHENQISYPWSPRDRDKIQNRDNHYGFINYVSALCADKVFFNSKFHMNSFLDNLHPFLKNFPDHNEIGTISIIKEKSSVLHVGLELSKFKTKSTNKSNPPVILWNHRWEYDKNPELFFDILKTVKGNGFKFKLIVIGESFGNYPKIFKESKIQFEEDILEWGYLRSFDDYAKCLYRADILPVTSNQEFFGVSVMEAVHCGIWPILPNKLSYRELFADEGLIENVYHNDSTLIKKIENAISNVEYIRENSLEYISNKYKWENIIKDYDNTFEKMI